MISSAVPGRLIKFKIGHPAFLTPGLAPGVVVCARHGRTLGGASPPRKLTTVSKVKRNCGRATDRGEEAWSEVAGRWTRTGYRAMPTKASGHDSAKLLWSRVRQRKSGGRAMKECVLTRGDLVLRVKARR